MKEQWDEFWSVPASQLVQDLGTSVQGLTTAEATLRLRRFGFNALKSRKHTDELTLLLGQFRSPLILILLFAAVLSFFLHDSGDAAIIMAIVLASGLLGFWQERGAAHAVEKLLRVVQTTAAVLRDGAEREIPVVEVVPGDVVVLSAGKTVPGGAGSCRSAQDLFGRLMVGALQVHGAGIAPDAPGASVHDLVRASRAGPRTAGGCDSMPPAPSGS